MSGIRQCKDGHVQIGFIEEHQWKGLVDLMGNPDWATDEKVSTREGRMRHAGELAPKVLAWLAEHTVEEVFHGGQARSVPVAPVRNAQEVVDCPQLKSRGFFVEVERGASGRLKHPGAPYHLEKTPWQARRPAPHLGEHNREVFCDILGLSRQELVRLRQQGVI